MRPSSSTDVPGWSGPPFGTISWPSASDSESYMLIVFHSPPRSYSVPSSSVTVELPNTSFAVFCTSSLTSAAIVS